MTDTLEDHTRTVKIGGRTITNLCFDDGIDVIPGDEQELAKLVKRLDTTPAACGMGISAEKTKLVTNKPGGINTVTRVCGEKLLVISYKNRITNAEVRNKITKAVGPHEHLLTAVKKRTSKRYGHVTRSTGLTKTILQGTGRQRRRWEETTSNGQESR